MYTFPPSSSLFYAAKHMILLDTWASMREPNGFSHVNKIIFCFLHLLFFKPETIVVAYQ
jgi:hypothetical protein